MVGCFWFFYFRKSSNLAWQTIRHSEKNKHNREIKEDNLKNVRQSLQILKDRKTRKENIFWLWYLGAWTRNRMQFRKRKASDTSKHEGQLVEANRGKQTNSSVGSAAGFCIQLTSPSLRLWPSVIHNLGTSPCLYRWRLHTSAPHINPKKVSNFPVLQVKSSSWVWGYWVMLQPNSP